VIETHVGVDVLIFGMLKAPMFEVPSNAPLASWSTPTQPPSPTPATTTPVPTPAPSTHVVDTTTQLSVPSFCMCHIQRLACLLA
jgi:hypothetical protein